MQIGTAAPTKTELATVKHHFIHHKSIKDNYNVGSFEKDGINCLNSLFKTYNVVIMVGGSGLYVDAVTKGLDHFPDVDKSIRTQLNSDLKLKGLDYLQQQLKQLDIESYNNIAIDNPHRVIRALEICIGTGKPYASFLNKAKQERSFNTITVGLNANRDIIYSRINQRVDIMLEEGLLNEVKSLKEYKHLNALNTVGYKELFNYLDGEWSLEFAISEIKKNTRRFAKRQLTWFKKTEDIIWFDYKEDASKIIKDLETKIK
ncbi:tRNA dimethylallyltransferase [Jejuia pallidilutea]|uniref:tRNA dimethylallyltransferase n=2 Tax=Jejuia pallidilutea TaxID=504487 RepID=A0A362WZC0_9FLAO|nr:tRNA dimethylallyltransferase [Jejuia pallidilutea]